MIHLKIENIDDMKEIKETEFCFSGECGVIRNENNIIIGFFEINIDNTELELETIEILEDYQSQGYGTQFLDLLFERYPSINEIKGLSKEEAVDFYANYGAEFHETCSDCDCEECQFHPGNFSDDYESEDEETCDNYSEYNFIIKRKNI